jgi:hypothetical protein
VTSLLATLARCVAGLPGWQHHGVRGLDVALPSAHETPKRPPVFERSQSDHG